MAKKQIEQDPPAEDHPATVAQEKDPKDLKDPQDLAKPKVFRPRLFTGDVWEDDG
jgi:hypothetical protein